MAGKEEAGWPLAPSRPDMLFKLDIKIKFSRVVDTFLNKNKKSKAWCSDRIANRFCVKFLLYFLESTIIDPKQKILAAAKEK